MEKKKILVISDHALSPSGVANQTKFLIEGLIKKGDMSFRQLGAAISHENYETIKVNEDFFIKPINSFGDKALLRNIIVNENPDAIIIFQDPRFFKYMFEMEDEIRQVCPILWWHVWDNYPDPKFNHWMYESVDKINCHSYLTYKIVSQNFKEKTEFIPHSLPKDIFFKIKEKKINRLRSDILKEKSDWFNVLWINRNAKRKRPGDLLISWKYFLDNLQKQKGHKKANLILHTDPLDKNGPNLLKLSEHLKLDGNITFSNQSVDNDVINILHNITDCTINISYNEGFGLSTLQSLQTGTPIIAVKTGGLTRQVKNHKTGYEYGVALNVDFKLLNGNQETFYIYEDYASNENISRSIMKIYNMSSKQRKKIGTKAIDYLNKNFSYDSTVNLWYKSIVEEIEKHKKNKNNLVFKEI